MAQPHTHFEISTVKEGEDKLGTIVKIEGTLVDIVASLCRTMEKNKHVETMILLASEAYCQVKKNQNHENRG